MYKRTYSLKSKYEFSKLFREGKSSSTSHLIIRYTTSNLEKDLKPLFGIVISSKFSKKAVVRNQLKRYIAESLRPELENVKNGHFVFIPKKNILNDNGKINVNVQTLSAEINTFLSTMVVL